MQLAQHGERRFAVQLPDIPVVVFEDQLAREEDAIRKLLVYYVSELCQFLDRVSAEGKERFGGKPVAVTVVDEEFQSLIGLRSQPFRDSRNRRSFARPRYGHS